jgi:hypothetical protein
MDEEGNLGRLVRANIQAASDEVYQMSLFSESNSRGPWHPVEKILNLILAIDSLVVGSISW